MAGLIDTFRAAESKFTDFYMRVSPPAAVESGTPAGAMPVDALYLSAASPSKLLPTLPGIKAGDTLDIDGPLWANGSGTIQRNDGHTLEFTFSVKDPTDLPGVRTLVNNPYTRKGGKLALSLKIESLDDGRVRTRISDLNNPKFQTDATGTMVQSTRGGRKQLVVVNPDVSLTITVLGEGKFNVALSTVPGSFDITKH